MFRKQPELLPITRDEVTYLIALLSAWTGSWT